MAGGGGRRPGFRFEAVYTAYRRDGAVTGRGSNRLEAATSTRWQRLARLMPWLAVAGLVVAFAWRLALTQGILARGDTFLYFYPIGNIAHRRCWPGGCRCGSRCCSWARRSWRTRKRGCSTATGRWQSF